MKIELKDTGEIFDIENDNIHKYDMKSIIDIVLEFIQLEKSKITKKQKEYITEEDLHILLESIGYIPIKKGYYDTYNRLAFIEYKEIKDRRSKRIILPIKPKSLSGELLQERIVLLNKLPKKLDSAFSSRGLYP